LNSVKTNSRGPLKNVRYNREEFLLNYTKHLKAEKLSLYTICSVLALISAVNFQSFVCYNPEICLLQHAEPNQATIFVHYNRVYVITVIVKTEFDCMVVKIEFLYQTFFEAHFATFSDFYGKSTAEMDS
jgi:hypothetical protein